MIKASGERSKQAGWKGPNKPRTGPSRQILQCATHYPDIAACESLMRAQGN